MRGFLSSFFFGILGRVVFLVRSSLGFLERGVLSSFFLYLMSIILVLSGILQLRAHIGRAKIYHESKTGKFMSLQFPTTTVKILVAKACKNSVAGQRTKKFTVFKTFQA